MSLFLVQNDRFDSAEADIISISTMDTGIGLNEAAPTTIEGVTCVEVTYARSQPGVTAVRLDDLVHDTGFTTPQEIIAMAVPSGTTISGILIESVAGVAFPIGSAGSPFAQHICTVYDADDCNGTGHWVDQEGGGTTSFPRDVILYHELSHCFAWATGVATTEPLAEADENDMRDARGLPHRDTSSHTGGCGGGPSNCCIVATLATGSPYSEEIKRFRYFREHTLRQSLVGDDFFREFHYRYYGFSPEITRLMGHRPSVKPVIRKYLVLPLLAGVEMLIYYSDNRGEGIARFISAQAKRTDLGAIYEKDFLAELSRYIELVRRFDTDAMAAALQGRGREYSGVEELLGHISRAALKDGYIDWSLVSVVELWVESALSLYSGRPETQLDSEIRARIARWISMMPISGIWDELSRLETRMELQSLEQFMFDPMSREIFSKRLIEARPTHRETAIEWAKRGGL